MAGSIVKAPDEQLIAFSNQPHMCDICTYSQWEYYTIIITVIRPCEEAGSALTCVKAEEHFSHIAVDQQDSAPLCCLEAFSEGLCDQSSDAQTSSPKGRAWNLSRGIAGGGRERGGGALTRLNHTKVCTSDFSVTRQHSQTHVSTRKVESHSTTTGHVKKEKLDIEIFWLWFLPLSGHIIYFHCQRFSW